MITDPVIRQLKHFNIPASAFEKAQIVCLPENFLLTDEFSKLHETTDLISIIKEFRARDVKVFSLMDAGFDVPSMDRRSGDKWLGTLWIREHALVPLAVTVIGTVVGGLILNEMEHEKTKPVEQVVVHTHLVIGTGQSQVKLDYVGDGSTLIKMLNSVSEIKDESKPTQTHHK